MGLIIGTTALATAFSLVAWLVGQRRPDLANAFWRAAVLTFLLLPLGVLVSDVLTLHVGLAPENAAGCALDGAVLPLAHGEGPEGTAVTARMAAADTVHGVSSPATERVPIRSEGRGWREHLRASLARHYWFWISQANFVLPWWGGTLMLLAWMLRDVGWVRWLTLSGAARNTRAQSSEVADTAREVGLRQPPAILVSRKLPVAIVLGLLRPRVVLPEPLDLTREGARAVLAHEMAHVARGDLAWAMVARIARLVWWWHPLVHLAAAQLRRSAELACDDRAIEVTGDGGGLASQLAAGAERSLGMDVAISGGEAKHVQARVRRLLGATRPRATLSRRASVALTLASVALIAGLGCVRHERKAHDAPLPPYPAAGERAVLLIGQGQDGRADTVVLAFAGFSARRLGLVALAPSLPVARADGSSATLGDLLGRSATRQGVGANGPGAEACREAWEALGLPHGTALVAGLPRLRSTIGSLRRVTVDVAADMQYVDRAEGFRVDLEAGRQRLGPDGMEQFIRYVGADTMSLPEDAEQARCERQLQFLAAARRRLVAMRVRRQRWDLHALGWALNSCRVDGLPVSDCQALVRFASEVPADGVRAVVIADAAALRTQVADMERWVAGE